MKEIKPTKSKFHHKAFANNSPLFRLMSKKEFALFIATLELEIKDYYKDIDNNKTDTRPP